MGIPGVTPDWWDEWGVVTLTRPDGFSVQMSECPKCKGLFIVPVEHQCVTEQPVIWAGGNVAITRTSA
jgi:hypothetical protein